MTEKKLLSAREKIDLLLKWQELELKQQEIVDQLKDTLLEQGSFKIDGVVKANVTKPKGSYDWKAAAEEKKGEEVFSLAVEKHTETPEPKTNWKLVCKYLGITMEEIQYTPGVGLPSISISLEQ